MPNSMYARMRIHPIPKEVPMDSQTLSQEVTEMHADLCSALADPSRILLLYALSERPRNVSELAELIGISQPGASRHLKLLRERGLVKAVRIGPAIEYSLQDLRLIEALDTLRAVLRDRIAYRASLIDLDVE
jgi:DNA-binding transcriptional ArsR family regulator